MVQNDLSEKKSHFISRTLLNCTLLSFTMLLFLCGVSQDFTGQDRSGNTLALGGEKSQARLPEIHIDLCNWPDQ